jgi:hypothetical protein
MRGDFFSRHLKEEIFWKIQGADDIENWKPPQARLIECIDGLESGQMFFVDVGMPLT